MTVYYDNASDDEKRFLDSYNPLEYGEPWLVTVDILCTKRSYIRTGVYSKAVLVVKRGQYPYKGLWALPGGFVDPTDASPAEAAARELREEAGLDLERTPALVGVRSGADRDPRGQSITSIFTTHVSGDPEAYAGDDAVEVAWVRHNDLHKYEFAFDHLNIIKEYMR